MMQKRSVRGPDDHLPDARDYLRGRDPRSLRPEPRLPDKYALNPPIVTIFGAGVAGLTAAHELVERGFVVQVLEQTEDRSSPGRPLVGGMAANQQARVRGNVEDLHPALIQSALNPGNAPPAKVARWLLRLFTFNRSRWLGTEVPARFHQVLYSDPDEEVAFRDSLLKSLFDARDAYRGRWVWDLICRGVLLGFLKFSSTSDPRQQLEHALALQQELKGCPINKLAELLLKAQLAVPDSPGYSELPSLTELAGEAEDLVVPALEREFLYFRLVPYARSGMAGLSARAHDFLSKWSGLLREQLGASCASTPSDATRSVIERADAPVKFPDEYDVWLNVDVVEQRLPGEHGYRFFPSFYRHLDDTMKRIPIGDQQRDGQRTVFDNLRPTVFQGISFTPEQLEEHGVTAPWDDTDPSFCSDPSPRLSRQRAKQPASKRPSVVEIQRDRPQTFEGLRDRSDRFIKRLGGTQRDALLLFAKLARFATSSSERRRSEYERVSWQEFIDVKKFSPAMQAQIASAAQALLAFSVAEVDARTYGNVALQLLFDELQDGSRVDRTLNGPTSDAWLEPWRQYLEAQGVRFFCLSLTGLELVEGEVRPLLADPRGNLLGKQQLASHNAYALLSHENEHEGLRPDFYIMALSLERANALVSSLPRDEKLAPDFAKLGPFFQRVVELKALKDMTGIQLFFDAKTSIGNGHMYFPYSKWGLSSISQSEFWSTRGRFADGYFGVLSVDICETGDYDSPRPGSFWYTVKYGADGKLTGDDFVGYRQLSLAREVWQQMVALIGDGDRLAEPRCYHIDASISPAGNSSKFLGSVKGLDGFRPGRSSNESCVGEDEILYSLNYSRWVLCGTYMATHTRMTTMEAANESARHAVRAILEQLEQPDSKADEFAELNGEKVQFENLRNNTYNGASNQRVYDPPDIWDPEQQGHEDLDFLRRVDRRLLRLGLKHFMDIIDFDRKFEHALDAIDIYGGDQPLPEFLGALLSSLDSALVKELGLGYEDIVNRRSGDLPNSVAKFGGALPEPPFHDMNGLLERFRRLFASFKIA